MRAMIASAAIAAALLFAGAAHASRPVAPALDGAAPAQTLTIANTAHVRPAELERFELAMILQVEEARAAWPAMPRIRFGAGGWPVELVHRAPTACDDGKEAGGCHFLFKPRALVGYVSPQDNEWTAAASHEILEMLADPTGLGLEICDPVELNAYRISGVLVSDYVLPDGSDYLERRS